MSQEIRANISLQVTNTAFQYRSVPSSFVANQTTPFGKTPGGLHVPVFGIDIDLTKFVLPGIIWMYNFNAIHYITYGIWEAALSEFHPLGELQAGDIHLFRLSRDILKEYAGTGTHPTADPNTFHMKASKLSTGVDILCDIFDS